MGARGCWRRRVLYQFHTVGSRGNLIPFHPSLSRCHSLPQVVIALTASSRLLEEGKKRRRKRTGGVTKLRAGMLLDGDKNDISAVHRHWLMLHYTLPL